jgi:hypothetical protein
MTDSPSVTWPSPASTTLPSRRTDKTVVERISRFFIMSAILYYSSANVADKNLPIAARVPRQGALASGVPQTLVPL